MAVGRTLKSEILSLLKKFPIVTLTGTRQCGKTTLLRESLPDFGYVSLEPPDIREFAARDPRGFLKEFGSPCIIDEAQQVPELFSYLQSLVDDSGKMGEYILSGSHNFLLMQNITQSLAGRTAVLRLAPFSITELKRADIEPETVIDQMFKGFYPAIYARNIEPPEYFMSYIQTYIERDVRQIKNIVDTGMFIRFVRLCAARSGQVLNRTELAASCGITVPTVNAWLSVLEQSYIISFLHPYYNNYSKRLVKSPKLYFNDTGLMCNMLGIESADELDSSPLKGAVFETMMINEYIKSRYFKVKEIGGYFWRDTNGNEVDLLVEEKGRLKAYEIKLSHTMNIKFLNDLQKFKKLSGMKAENVACIYSGDRNVHASYGNFLRYDKVFE